MVKTNVKTHQQAVIVKIYLDFYVFIIGKMISEAAKIANEGKSDHCEFSGSFLELPAKCTKTAFKESYMRVLSVIFKKTKYI